jgi:hypothetical protein
VLVMVVFRAEEQNHLQLMEREEMDGEDDLFEAIEKCKIQIISSLSLSALPIVSSIDFYSHPPPCLSVLMICFLCFCLCGCLNHNSNFTYLYISFFLLLNLDSRFVCTFHYFNLNLYTKIVRCWW